MLIYALLIAIQIWALVDCLRHRPGSFWILAILFLGPLGALAYVVSELWSGRRFAPPATAGLTSRRRIREIQALTETNPAPALFVELGDLQARKGDPAAAAVAYARALDADEADLYARYHLGLALAAQNEHGRAAEELAKVVAAEAKYDYGAAAEALADALIATEREDEALPLYAHLATTSARSRPKYQYALLLDRRGRLDEAAGVMREIVSERDAIPAYLRATEMPWIRKAEQYLKSRPSAA